jgi:hypothetical protein
MTSVSSGDRASHVRADPAHGRPAHARQGVVLGDDERVGEQDDLVGGDVLAAEHDRPHRPGRRPRGVDGAQLHAAFDPPGDEEAAVGEHRGRRLAVDVGGGDFTHRGGAQLGVRGRGGGRSAGGGQK